MRIKSSEITPEHVYISRRKFMKGLGISRPEMGKFYTALAVWAPYRASAGTRISPSESFSMR